MTIAVFAHKSLGGESKGRGGAGASDQLRHQENGLLIRAGDAAAIREALEWCLAQRPRLRAMREAAAATAAHWQWSDYRRALATALREAGFFGKP